MHSLDIALTKINSKIRDYQQRLVTKTMQQFQQPFIDRFGRNRSAVNSILIESPTGSGKTFIGLLTALCLQLQFGFSVGWVAMRCNLLAQAAAENLRHGFNVNMELISMFDKNPPQVDLLIVDEAQHDGARSMASLHARVRPRKLLGLTATPYRSDRVKLCFQQVNRDFGIEQLIRAGYLSEYHHYTIPEYTPAKVAQTYLRDHRRWGKSLMFFHRQKECFECQRELAAVGINAEVVTAQTNRQRQIEAFAAGTVPVLISMSILAEGFDCPSLQTVFCRPSGKGPSIQMCGRVFRKHPKLPFKQIVQCGQSRYPITRSATPAEQYNWTDERWQVLKANKNLSAISLRTLQIIADTRTKLPDLVAQHKSQNRFARTPRF